MKFVTPEEAGTIIARLVIADEKFSQELLEHAKNSNEKLFPDDVENLTDWINLMRIIGNISNTDS